MKIGLIKDETRGVPISQFCSLKPKMHSFEFGNECKKKQPKESNHRF